LCSPSGFRPISSGSSSASRPPWVCSIVPLPRHRAPAAISPPSPASSCAIAMAQISGGALHHSVHAAVPARDPCDPCRCDTEIAKSEMVFSFGRSARTARTSSSAALARITVAEIGASSVTDRVAEFRSAKRTRTITVRPGLDLARGRVPMRSARCSGAGRKTRSSPGLRRIADCAPAETRHPSRVRLTVDCCLAVFTDTGDAGFSIMMDRYQMSQGRRARSAFWHRDRG
jgi:hypothetical protein